MNTLSFNTVAEQLLHVVLKLYGLTLREIVLDFIKDINGIEWFIGCRSFKVVPRVKVEDVLDKVKGGLVLDLVKNNAEVRKRKLELKREELVEKATTSTLCKLCKIKFRREQLRRVVTDSMLSKFVSHLRKRGVFTFDFS